jgi:CP family cyanate transporter-like MFS transporter
LAGLVLLALVPSQAPYLAVVLIAFGNGGAFTLGMTLPLDNTQDAAEANAWTAFCLTIGYLIAAAGPYLVGALRDLTGGFSVPVWVLVAVGLIQLVVTPALRPQTYQPASEA